MNQRPSADPRHFAVCGGLPGDRPSHDRMARIAARRRFVDLKRCFMSAVADLDDERGRWLRQQVHRAEKPDDLLLLRGHVFARLAGTEPQRQTQRRMLRRNLDSLFPDSAPRSVFAAF